jgi:hypothetical protein
LVKKRLNTVSPGLGDAMRTLLEAVKNEEVKQKTLINTRHYLNLPNCVRSLLQCMDAQTIQAIKNELNRETPWAGELFERIITEIKAGVMKDLEPFLSASELAQFPYVRGNLMEILGAISALITQRPYPKIIPHKPLWTKLLLQVGSSTYKCSPSSFKEWILGLEQSALNTLGKNWMKNTINLGMPLKTSYYF